MKLVLNGLEVMCVIGERPDERTRLQRLVVDIVLEVEDGASASDEIADAVDYAALAERVRAALVAARCRLIERAARTVCETCLDNGRVRAVRATVTKAGAVPGLASASATFAARRQVALSGAPAARAKK